MSEESATTLKGFRPTAQGCGTPLPGSSSPRVCHNPERVPSHSPGLRYSAILGGGASRKSAATLGRAARESVLSCCCSRVGECFNANRLASRTNESRRNPFRVGVLAPPPRVAEYGNPGLWEATPRGCLVRTER